MLRCTYLSFPTAILLAMKKPVLYPPLSPGALHQWYQANDFKSGTVFSFYKLLFKRLFDLPRFILRQGCKIKQNRFLQQ